MPAPSRSGITDPSAPPISLIEGSSIRCPNCEELRDLNHGLKRYDRNEKYAMELNVVYQCRKDHGGCGHIFSLGDQRVILAFLNGDLVPADQIRVIKRELLEVTAERDALLSSSHQSLQEEVTRA